jgi:hypothetical protein
MLIFLLQLHFVVDDSGWKRNLNYNKRLLVTVKVKIGNNKTLCG